MTYPTDIDQDALRRQAFQGAPIDVPETVATCPYCHAPLTVEAWEWYERPDGTLRVTLTHVDCTEAPEPGDEAAWRAFLRRHGELPYVYWLPVEDDVLAWLNAQLLPDPVPGRDVPCPHTLDLFDLPADPFAP